MMRQQQFRTNHGCHVRTRREYDAVLRQHTEHVVAWTELEFAPVVGIEHAWPERRAPRTARK